MSLVKLKKDEQFSENTFFWNDFFDPEFWGRGLELGTSEPAASITETNKTFNIEVAIPGGKKEDIDLDIDGNTLTISLEKKEEKEENEGIKKKRMEFNCSSFRRSFQLPENVDPDKIKAEYKLGVLNVHLPKKESSKVVAKKKIAVHWSVPNSK